jgi:hypothetical protein
MNVGPATADAMDAARRFDTFVGVMDSALTRALRSRWPTRLPSLTSIAPICSDLPGYSRTSGHAWQTDMHSSGSDRSSIPPSLPMGRPGTLRRAARGGLLRRREVTRWATSDILRCGKVAKKESDYQRPHASAKCCLRSRSLFAMEPPLNTLQDRSWNGCPSRREPAGRR